MVKIINYLFKYSVLNLNVSVQAVDADKEGKTVLTYRIVSTNSDVLTVDAQTGEVRMVMPVSSSHTSRGQYELVVRAADDGW